MEDQSLIETIKKVGEGCKIIAEKYKKDEFSLRYMQAQARHHEELAKKAKEEHELVKQAIDQAKQTADSIISLAKEEAEKIKALATKEYSEARLANAESKKIKEELRLQLATAKV